MIKQIAIFSIAIAASTLAAAAQCRPLEYQEIKDMKTLELRDKLWDYFNIHNDVTDLGRWSSVPNKREVAEQCETEIKRMSEYLVKRKDYMKIRKTQSYGVAFGTLYSEKYAAIIGPLRSGVSSSVN